MRDGVGSNLVPTFGGTLRAWVLENPLEVEEGFGVMDQARGFPSPCLEGRKSRVFSGRRVEDRLPLDNRHRRWEENQERERGAEKKREETLAREGERCIKGVEDILVIFMWRRHRNNLLW